VIIPDFFVKRAWTAGHGMRLAALFATLNPAAQSSG
jgi:hypothetical protein